MIDTGFTPYELTPDGSRMDKIAGRRILVVEDQMLISLMIEGALEDLGCVVIGPAFSLKEAMRLANEEQIDAAILDINIVGGDVFPVADRLRERSVPFVLASGVAESSLPPNFRGQPRLLKPFVARDIEFQVRRLCDTLMKLQ